MTTVEDIEKAIERLAPREFDRLRVWFEEYQAAHFDEKITRDAEAGKLDRFAERRWRTSARAAPASYEAFREPGVLGCLRELPVAVRELADRNYALLKGDPRHPSLRFKKVGRFWSVRMGLRYRALATEADGDMVWFWIGSHADYDALIR